MVCNRCILVVRQELEKLHLQINNISLGEAELAKVPSTKQIQQLNEALEKLGFELLDTN